MQRRSTLSLFRNNAEKIFSKPYSIESNGNLTVTLFHIVHSLTFIATVPIGATIKTIVDVHVRKPLAQQDIENAVKLIENMEDDLFDRFVTTVSNVRVKSQGSIDLLNKLGEHYQLEIKQTEEFKSTQETKIHEKRIKQLIETNPDLQNQFDISTIKPVTHFTLSPEEEKEFTAAVTQAKSEFAQARRLAQKKELKDYLLAEKNVGKKLQHAIVDKSGAIPTVEFKKS